MFKIVNGYEDVDRNMFLKLKEGSRTRGHKAALVKEQRRLDMRKYSFSQRVTNEWNKLSNECVNASSVNMFKNKICQISDKGGLYIKYKIVGLSISQWLPCPLAIWNVLFGMAVLLNLNLYINTQTLGSVWRYLLPGYDVHSPLSMFLRLLRSLASDLPIGDVLTNTQM